MMSYNCNARLPWETTSSWLQRLIAIDDNASIAIRAEIQQLLVDETVAFVAAAAQAEDIKFVDYIQAQRIAAEIARKEQDELRINATNIQEADYRDFLFAMQVKAFRDVISGPTLTNPNDQVELTIDWTLDQDKWMSNFVARLKDSLEAHYQHQHPGFIMRDDGTCEIPVIFIGACGGSPKLNIEGRSNLLIASGFPNQELGFIHNRVVFSFTIRQPSEIISAKSMREVVCLLLMATAMSDFRVYHILTSGDVWYVFTVVINPEGAFAVDAETHNGWIDGIARMRYLVSQPVQPRVHGFPTLNDLFHVGRPAHSVRGGRGKSIGSARNALEQGRERVGVKREAGQVRRRKDADDGIRRVHPRSEEIPQLNPHDLDEEVTGKLPAIQMTMEEFFSGIPMLSGDILL